MYRGYVKLWRKSFESTVWNNPNVWRFWCWCLMKATHKEYETKVGFQDILLKPGEFIFGLHKCAEETGLSVQTIRTTLKSLNGKKLTRKVTNKFSIICIDNWGSYQMEPTEANKLPNKQLTSKQQATNKQLTTNKNDKNKKNDKKVYIKPFLGEFKNVKLQQEEYEKLQQKFPDSFEDKIENISHYIESKGDKYKSHYATILSWSRRDEKDRKVKQDIKPTTYAQAQDAEKRMTAKWLLKEMKNDKQKDGDQRINKDVPCISSEQAND